MSRAQSLPEVNCLARGLQSFSNLAISCSLLVTVAFQYFTIRSKQVFLQAFVPFMYPYPIISEVRTCAKLLESPGSPSPLKLQASAQQAIAVASALLWEEL